jgi:hypothetical protein
VVGDPFFRLMPDSPAVDAGTSDGTPTTDRGGRARFDVPEVANRGAGLYPYYDIGANELRPEDAVSP